jgi:hypothetical protein
MKTSTRSGGKVLAQRKRTLIKTTFLELLGNLIDRTPDDDALIATVKRIFDVSDVRLVRSLAPVQLVTEGTGSTGARRRRFDKAEPAWV